MTHRFRANWIGAEMPFKPEEGIAPSPRFTSEFTLSGKEKSIIVYLCSCGYHVLRINGAKPDDRVLAPSPMQFDRHVPYLRYDLTKLCRTGKNRVEILLGNGFFNDFPQSAWNSRYSAWLWETGVKFLCDIEVDGKTLPIRYPRDWSCQLSPIVFNALHNGEYYDARLEDAPQTVRCTAAKPPPGIPAEDILEPCKVERLITPISQTEAGHGVYRFDFGINFTGYAQILVCGKAGDTVTLRYGERLAADGALDRKHISMHIHSGEIQTDRYILAGRAEGERWAPSFVYHGFQYVEAVASGEAKIVEIKGCFVHTSFRQVGAFRCDNAMLNALQKATRQSYLSNFTGLPTDCPHREKNGWTGDAQLAMETGLWNFDAARGYLQFLQMTADTQHAAGSIHSITPAGPWGLYAPNPAWDFVLFEIPYRLYQFGGEAVYGTVIRKFYPVLKKYLAFCAGCEEDDLLEAGLGDWCPPDREKMAPPALTSSACYCAMFRRMAFFAGVLKRDRDAKYFARQADRVRRAFRQRFRHQADGSWGNGGATSYAAALYFGLTATPADDAAKLAEIVRQERHTAQFGILGAKWVPRVLADHGYIDDAVRLFTQEEYPGWGNWIKQGATTLHENWQSTSSLNHIMFGDVSAWMYEYLGGIKPLLEFPSFKKFQLKPLFPAEVSEVDCSFECPQGKIVSRWRKSADGKTADCYFEIPANTTAVITLPSQPEQICNGPFKGEIRCTLQAVFDRLKTKKT